METLFDDLPEPSPDQIFAANQRARAAGNDVINGTVGMILDEDGKVAVLPSVRAAMREIADEHPDVAYAPLKGIDGYRAGVQKFLGLQDAKIASVATTGGTEAVSLNARLINEIIADAQIVVPTPTWGNHEGVLRHTGIHSHEVSYLNMEGRPSVRHIIKAIHEGFHAVLLHGTCHNPTGLDLNPEQWEELAKKMAEYNTIALVDIAYQGLGAEPQDDAQPIHTLARHGVPTLYSWSGSKNHTIYNERAGLAGAIAPSDKAQKKIQGVYERLLRTSHSSSPSYGQRIVAAVQERHAQEHATDLRAVRETVGDKRRALSALLPEEFQYPLSGNGMFAILPITPDQVTALEQKKVFVLADGRINIAGIPSARIPELADKIREVL